MSKPMTDSEVISEMKKLVCTSTHTHTRNSFLYLTDTLCVGQVAFIKQEAMEKAREIKVKADEEFSIEKVSHRVV
jgi:V-type H+-transporting ATPase subunit E